MAATCGILFGQDFKPVDDRYMKKSFKLLATLRNSSVIVSMIAEYNISVCMHGRRNSTFLSLVCLKGKTRY